MKQRHRTPHRHSPAKSGRYQLTGGLAFIVRSGPRYQSYRKRLKETGVSPDEAIIEEV